MNGFYLTYNSGAGIFGYCGESKTQPPFYYKGHAIIFANRKEARAALKHFRKAHGINLRHYAARDYAITPADRANIGNR